MCTVAAVLPSFVRMTSYVYEMNIRVISGQQYSTSNTMPEHLSRGTKTTLDEPPEHKLCSEMQSVVGTTIACSGDTLERDVLPRQAPRRLRTGVVSARKSY